MFWGSILATYVMLAGGETIEKTAPISLGLFVAGILGTILIVWRARGEWAALVKRMADIERRISNLYKDDK